MRNTDYGHVLENIVYLEVVRGGYDVSISKIGDLEVDFLVTKSDSMEYYQVTASILDEQTREHELRPLQTLPGNYPKTILTMDPSPYQDYGGIQQHIVDFLLKGKP